MSNDKKKVLLIEDDEAIAELVKDYISDDCEVDYVANGKNAIIKVADSSYSTIIMDNTLPDVQGIELIQDVLKIKPKSKIIMMTGSENPEIKEKAMAAGAKDFVVKDVAMSFLDNILNAIKK